ncbi:DUF3891 family protein [Paenibacillus alvei]|uniref:DUF3891 family protein n=1 Tax=Paenibacillus alvei TaxID=44250 RepID=UPI0013DA9C7B|nr:DUF3891 family protein [Paenibacillus alvei]NEZ42101.1 DUF3891 family protein [Paenibacillus alvei]
MIIRTRKDEIVFIAQHDHGYLSGEIASKFRTELLGTRDGYEDAVYAAYEHDCSWIGLDDTPIWNDAQQEPYTFMDYPMPLRLAFYRKGLDDIEKVNPYASLLCSKHFASFFHVEEQKDVIEFLQHERQRQRRIKEQFVDLPDLTIANHFRMLQFCDDLSLYVSLNEPGVSKDKEFPWYQDGFERTEPFNVQSGEQLQAEWLDDRAIRVTPTPFTEPFTAMLSYKVVAKERIRKIGIASAYKEAERRKQVIHFV